MNVGDKVSRPGIPTTAHNYTNGRKGTVIEVSADRVRVQWTHEYDGQPMFEPIKTWAKKSAVVKE